MLSCTGASHLKALYHFGRLVTKTRFKDLPFLVHVCQIIPKISRRLYQLGREISIEEPMIRFKGRNAMKVYIKQASQSRGDLNPFPSAIRRATASGPLSCIRENEPQSVITVFLHMVLICDWRTILSFSNVAIICYQELQHKCCVSTALVKRQYYSLLELFAQIVQAFQRHESI